MRGLAAQPAPVAQPMPVAPPAFRVPTRFAATPSMDARTLASLPSLSTPGNSSLIYYENQGSVFHGDYLKPVCARNTEEAQRLFEKSLTDQVKEKGAKIHYALDEMAQTPRHFALKIRFEGRDDTWERRLSKCDWIEWSYWMDSTAHRWQNIGRVRAPTLSPAELLASIEEKWFFDHESMGGTARVRSEIRDAGGYWEVQILNRSAIFSQALSDQIHSMSLNRDTFRIDKRTGAIQYLPSSIREYSGQGLTLDKPRA
ncbi:hypothetical protein K2X33_02290 [bacterium]|nr:hypothetical protein [bacterium]